MPDSFRGGIEYGRVQQILLFVICGEQAEIDLRIGR
jgi:hypothetical protein